MHINILIKLKKKGYCLIKKEKKKKIIIYIFYIFDIVLNCIQSLKYKNLLLIINKYFLRINL